MKYSVRVAGREMEVELRREQGELVAYLEGRRRVVEHFDVDHLGQFVLRVENAAYAVSMESEGERYRVTIAGEGFTVECEDEREHAARALQGRKGPAGGIVESVMPGIVRAVEVEPGQMVEADQTLLILEAMKMQNEIKAAGKGVVKRVFVQVGATVGAGAKLVELEAAPGES